MKRYMTEKGKFTGLGPHTSEDRVGISVVADTNFPVSVELYNLNRKKIGSVPFKDTYRMGSVFSMDIMGIDPKECLYRIRSGKKERPDPYSRIIIGNDRFGKRDGYCSFETPGFEVRNKGPHIEWQDVILYLINVRAYTKDRSSGVSSPGTFIGLKEKIPYMRSLGITSLLLQPAYDFDEECETMADGVKRHNLWGYVPGNYYVPKPSYAESDPCREFFDLVEELHKGRMEIIMQFYFLPEHSAEFIIDVLRYWVMTYNVDGFEVLGAALPTNEIARDPYLTDTKLIFTDFDVDEIYGRTAPRSMNLAKMDDGFMYDMRRYLKGDEDMLEKVSSRILCNPDRCAAINFITSYYGFTLNDLVSYERKHNEKNGEAGEDGSDYNYSWNCGDEGSTRKKAVMRLRQKQMKNAMTLLILSQSVPMLRAGDEFANSQKGNNNAWCQDNKVSYLDWNDLEKNRDFHDHVKKLLKLRKDHKIFHGRYAKKMYDYISCGTPDVSFHGEQAWHPSFANYNRHFGILYSGAYERGAKGENDEDFYVAYNMHWTGHRFQPPKPVKGKKWKLFMSSGEDRESSVYDADNNELTVHPRSIAILMTEKAAAKDK